MKLLAIPPLASALFAFLLGIFILLNRPSSPVKRSFALLCFETFYWHSCWFATYFFFSPFQKNLIMRLAWTGITFIPVTYYQFAIEFLDIKKEKKVVRFLYVIAGLFLIPLWTTNAFISGARDFWFGYYPTVGPLHAVYLFIVVGFLFRSVVLLLVALKDPHLSSAERNRKRFAFICHAIYFITALEYFINYGIPLYPVGAITMPASFCVMVYAITRYQLLDVEALVKRTAVFAGLFVFAYGTFSVVVILGQRLFSDWLGWSKWAATIPTMAVIILVMKPLEKFLVELTDKYLFQKKYDYKQILQSYIDEVIVELDLDKVLKGTMELLNKTIHPENLNILFLQGGADAYTSYDKTVFLDTDSEISKYLKKNKKILSLEPQENSLIDKQIMDEMHSLHARIAIPLILQNELIGVMLLGKKKSDENYSKEDFEVLSALAKTAAIAIKNAKTNAELVTAKARQHLGDMADGMSHQFNNRFGTIVTLLGFQEILIPEAIKLSEQLDDKVKATKLINALQETLKAIAQARDSAERGGEISKTLLVHTRPEKAGFKIQNISKGVALGISIVALKHEDFKSIEMIEDIDPNIPPTWCSLSILQEIFLITLDNSYDSIKLRQQTDSLHKGKILISMTHKVFEKEIKIVIQDNGVGMSQRDLETVNAAVPYFTTKGSSNQKSGYGAGVHALSEYVGMLRGRYHFESTQGEGTSCIIDIPINREADN